MMTRAAKVALLVALVLAGDSAPSAAAQVQYTLAMSEDDAICEPILAAYDSSIDLDVGPRARPYPYPWPAPRQVSLIWTSRSWQGITADQQVLARASTVLEADVTGDGQKNLIVRLAVWHRGDDRFTSLVVFPTGTVLPENMDDYKKIQSVQAIATVVPGTYHLPKLKNKVQPTELNDFDVIHSGGREFVTGKTVAMDGTVELHDVPAWRVVARVRVGVPPRASPKLDLVLDSVCYFRLK